MSLLAALWVACFAGRLSSAGAEDALADLAGQERPASGSAGASNGSTGAAKADARTDWGSDHVEAAVPEFISGDECLFCHRDRFGSDWAKNRHERTLRPVDPAGPEIAALKAAPGGRQFADQVELFLGDRRQVRFAKRQQEYGKLALLSAKFVPPAPGAHKRRAQGKLVETQNVHWDNRVFAESCAGCHTTAVDPKTHAFTAISMDCFACHGPVDLKHSTNTALIYFGKGRRDAPHVEIAICAQCHLRNGKSKKSGLPYPTNFIAGDNLFRDFHVDLSDAQLAAMNPGDRHVAQNVREVLDGKSATTCVACHDVHRQSAAKHRQVAEGATCVSCHEPGKPKSQWTRYEVHSALCGY